MVHELWLHCAVAESSKLPGILWVGTDEGNVQLSRDGGGNMDKCREECARDRRDLSHLAR